MFFIFMYDVIFIEFKYNLYNEDYYLENINNCILIRKIKG